MAARTEMKNRGTLPHLSPTEMCKPLELSLDSYMCDLRLQFVTLCILNISIEMVSCMPFVSVICGNDKRLQFVAVGMQKIPYGCNFFYKQLN